MTSCIAMNRRQHALLWPLPSDMCGCRISDLWDGVRFPNKMNTIMELSNDEYDHGPTYIMALKINDLKYMRT